MQKDRRDHAEFYIVEETAETKLIKIVALLLLIS